MPDSKFDLGDYVEVKDRIKLFYELYGNGRLVTEWAEIWEHGGKVRVVVKAAAYRSPEDNHPAIGMSWMEVPGSTSYTKGSELENTETSAWGRAIAALGILVDRSIASGNEVRNKAGQEAPAEPGEGPAPLEGGDGSLIGTAEIGKPPSDFELRQTPKGQMISFRLSDGRKSIKVVAYDTLAETIATIRDDMIDQRVQVWGTLSDEAFTPKGTTKRVTYSVLTLHKVKTPNWTLPVEVEDPLEAELEAAIDALPVTLPAFAE